MKRLLVAVLPTVMLALLGCSGNSVTSGPESTPTSGSTAAGAPTASNPSASPSSAVPATQCLSGRYRLVRFVGVGDKERFGTGEGGDVTIMFNEGSYLLRGAGKEPIKLTLAGQPADLLVDGTIKGDHRVIGDKASFAVGESTGSASIRMGLSKESVTMEQVGSVLAGEAGIACASDALIVTLQDVRLEFGKV
ncbi:MAG TPA: hypothetical protein VJN19_01425 [Propionibacteriaceae bacterium]|nr:hypothetical protein [Propionibacteriaceae bacterium]